MSKRILEVLSDSNSFVEWSILVKTFNDNEEVKFQVNELNEMTASEAVVGFCAWLTSREERTTFSSRDNAGVIVNLISEFCEYNNLTEPREDWTDYFKMPPTEKTTKDE